VKAQEEMVALTSDEQLVYVTRMRMRSNTSTQTAAARIIKAGSPVPRVLWGRHKGLEVVLRERGLYPSNGLKGACSSAKACTSNCCCAKVLSAQADFLEERSALQHLVEERVQLVGTSMITSRHICFFLPKFHCELNWIERYWGASKRYARSHCLYTLAGLREIVPVSLSQDLSDIPNHLVGKENLPVVPLFLQRRWARITRQYMSEYMKGAAACDAIDAVKLQRTNRHRDTNDSRSKPVEARMAAMSGHM